MLKIVILYIIPYKLNPLKYIIMILYFYLECLYSCNL